MTGRPVCSLVPIPGFFIPDVAENAADGHAGFHARFAAALGEFSPWIAELIELDQATGVAAVVATYEELLTSRPGPIRSKVLSW